MTTYDNLPLKLKSNKRMCCWQYELKDGDETKVPYNPVTRRRAKSNDPTTYSDFASAVTAVGNFDGIGFFVGDEVSAIDLDDCFSEDGSLKPVAQDVVNNFKGSYMERSPSKKGLRIIFLTPGFTYDKIKFYINNQKIGMEIYVAGASNQYVTLTGYVYSDGDVIDQTTALKIVQEKYMIRPNRSFDL